MYKNVNTISDEFFHTKNTPVTPQPSLSMMSLSIVKRRVYCAST